MKMPKEIKVAGHIYSIKVLKHCTNDSKYEYAGRTYHNELRLEVSTHYNSEGKRIKKAAKSKVDEALLHEIIHAIDAKYNVNLREKQVRVFSEGLFQVLRDNDLNFRCSKLRKKGKN